MIIPTREIETRLKRNGARYVAGVDEVGRGCLAGPVVSAAVVLGDEVGIPLLRDSKQLSRIQREAVATQIKQQALTLGIGWVSAADVDVNGLSWAVRESGLRALKQLTPRPDLVILDGSFNFLAKSQYQSVAHIKADASEACVSAASIIAKVARDHYMQLLAVAHPAYGFDQHVGYGTIKHKTALAKHGPSPFHRRSFAGVLQ